MFTKRLLRSKNKLSLKSDRKGSLLRRLSKGLRRKTNFLRKCRLKERPNGSSRLKKNQNARKDNWSNLSIVSAANSKNLTSTTSSRCLPRCCPKTGSKSKLRSKKWRTTFWEPKEETINAWNKKWELKSYLKWGCSNFSRKTRQICCRVVVLSTLNGKNTYMKQSSILQPYQQIEQFFTTSWKHSKLKIWLLKVM